jgi:hypothetical protein
MTRDIPPVVEICPECGGWLYIDNYQDLIGVDGKLDAELIDGEMRIFCSEEESILATFDEEHPNATELRRDMEHRVWQNDWLPIHEVVKEWLLTQ